VVLATKVHGGMGPGPNDQGNSRVWIVREVEESLRRLDTDHIDLYQIHRPEPWTDVEETLGALPDLQRQGKIRYFGSSTFPGWQIVEAQWAAERRGLSRFRTEQPPYSIFVRYIEHDLLPLAQRYGMGVLVWSPLNRGWLAGRYRRDHFDRSPESRATRGAERAEWLAVLYYESRPEVRRKLDIVEELVRSPARRERRCRPIACPRPSRRDVGDHRTSDAGAARGPRRRRGPPARRSDARRDRRAGPAGDGRGRARPRLRAVVVRPGGAPPLARFGPAGVTFPGREFTDQEG
jgi:hypothetical protein